MNYLLQEDGNGDRIYIFIKNTLRKNYGPIKVIFAVKHYRLGTLRYPSWKILAEFESLHINPSEWAFHQMEYGTVACFLFREVLQKIYGGSRI